MIRGLGSSVLGRGRGSTALSRWDSRRWMANQSARMRDYYEVLGVGRQASQSDVKRAFYKLAKELHPDSGGDKEKFAEVNSAYQTLGDEKKRKIYDQFGHEGVQAADQGVDPTQNPFAGGGFSSGGFSGFGGNAQSGFGGFGNASAEEFLRDVSDFFGGSQQRSASDGKVCFLEDEKTSNCTIEKESNGEIPINSH